MTHSDQIGCPRGKDHDARMDWVQRNGVRTGALIAWCHTCRAPLDATTPIPEVTFTDRERQGELRPWIRPGERYVEQDERNERIRQAYRDGVPQKDLAREFRLTTTRVGQIIHGTRRSA